MKTAQFFKKKPKKATKLMRWGLFLMLCGGPFSESKTQDTPPIEVGAERMALYLPQIAQKRIGLVVHASARVKETHLVDTLLRLGVQIGRIFSPEHGYRGEAEAGASVKDQESHGIPIRSLYGAHRSPPPQDLKDLDILLFDLQDVGARFYTYASTLHYVMEATAVAKLPLILLDRPNPNGDYVDGPLRIAAARSFVGMHPIPIVHGLTLGELAQMINGEGWLKDRKKCRLQVIPIAGWTHQTPYAPPTRPSPNLPTFQAIRLYPSLCLFEGTVMSIGRGTSFPFEVIGYPEPILGDFSFVPVSVPGAAARPKHLGQRCYGRSLREVVPPRQLLLEPLLYFYAQFPDTEAFFLPYFDTLAGTPQLREQIIAGYSEKRIRASWQSDLQQYQKMRKAYLLYPDNE